MARCSRGGLMGLRLRRLISFLRRNRLHATAHAYTLALSRPAAAILLIGNSPYRLNLRINRRLERQSGVFFDMAHLRRMLLDNGWAAASSYSLRFVTLGNLSPEANALIICILVIADFAAGQAHSIYWLFQYIYANLDGYKEWQTIHKLLLSTRSDKIWDHKMNHSEGEARKPIEVRRRRLSHLTHAVRRSGQVCDRIHRGGCDW